MKGKVRTGKVNCQEWRHICKDAGINAYPTLKLYTGTSRTAKGVLIEGFAAKDIVEMVENYLTSDKQNVNHLKIIHKLTEN